MRNKQRTSFVRSVLKRLLYPFLTFYFKWYLKDKRGFKYKGLKLSVLPGVFHPNFFLSSKILMRFLESVDLKNTTLLELGAGSGAVGFYAEKLGAKVTLSDISNKAIEGLYQNASKLQSEATIVHSDLFDTIEASFDYIVINPPYYPKTPNSEEEMAWYCGDEFQYFKKLFGQLSSRIASGTSVFMILSEDCNLEHIESIALTHGLRFELSYQERRMWEWNFIFRIC